MDFGTLTWLQRLIVGLIGFQWFLLFYLYQTSLAEFHQVNLGFTASNF